MNINLDIIFLIAFSLILGLFLYLKKDKIKIQFLIKPLIYIIMYPTSLGLNLIDKLSSKYKNFINFVGYLFIGPAFIGLFYVSYMLIKSLYLFIIQKTKTTGIALVLPGTTIKGIGYLSFWHWIIAIVFIAFIHEFSHGIVAKSFGIKLKSTGFAIFGVILPFLPAAFVEPDEKQLNKAKDYKQYAVYAAGPMINIVLALLLIFLIPGIASQNPIFNFEKDYIVNNGTYVNIINNTPIYNAGLRGNVLIQEINNKEIKDKSDLMIYLGFCTYPNQTIRLKANNTYYNIKLDKNPNSKSGFLGITNPRNNIVIKKRYKFFDLIQWLKILLKWIVLLNLFIGLANLLPIFITDGARMIYVLFNSLFKKETAVLLFYIFNGFFVLVILAGLLLNLIL